MIIFIISINYLERDHLFYKLFVTKLRFHLFYNDLTWSVFHIYVDACISRV